MIFLYIYLVLGIVVPILLYTTNAIIIYRSYMREPKEIAPYAWIELTSREIKNNDFSDNYNRPELSLLITILLWIVFLWIQLKEYYKAYKKPTNSPSSLLERFARHRHRKLYPEQHI